MKSRNNPRYFNVGDAITITPETLEVMQNGNRSIKAYPCDAFVEKIAKYVGRNGVVTHVFRPSYEMTIEFDDGQAFHAHDNWIELTGI